MIHILLYISTAIVFLALDVVMLKKVMYPLFSANIGPMMLEDLRMGPAAVFYLFYVVGVVWFVSIPALNVGSIAQAFFAGAVLGALAYGTYEFTNFATLKGWTAQMVMVDVIWGAVLTGTSAAVGVAVTKYFT
ncbi:hypothetical protein pfor_14c1772 [Rhodobacteraceae bacterium SB2]|mgnify:FL=1|jgi:uncharacterized membrane protein|nr:DUF2177 domain-containing protein [Marinovum sp.]MBT4231061.1 DUF2177 family protein [Paracoccaceae bacterium]OAH07524.1 hypothetical protein pfor_14c1772 [Rhodobacteraceae bacterium SB2]OUV03016.1 MAG: hypothetical protein CBC39_03870 [Cellvibrionales bacterium TMED79]WQC63342.1 DUF2177 family protein [Alphaproteobacteria bacterium US3C007]